MRYPRDILICFAQIISKNKASTDYIFTSMAWKCYGNEDYFEDTWRKWAGLSNFIPSEATNLDPPELPGLYNQADIYYSSQMFSVCISQWRNVVAQRKQSARSSRLSHVDKIQNQSSRVPL